MHFNITTANENPIALIVIVARVGGTGIAGQRSHRTRASIAEGGAVVAPLIGQQSVGEQIVAPKVSSLASAHVDATSGCESTGLILQAHSAIAGHRECRQE